MRVKLPPLCGSCFSPRVAPALLGLPAPETQAAAERSEVFLGGCEIFDHGLDATFRCLDCGADDGHPDPLSVLRPPLARRDLPRVQSVEA
jgi:hypothetical protein